MFSFCPAPLILISPSLFPPLPLVKGGSRPARLFLPGLCINIIKAGRRKETQRAQRWDSLGSFSSVFPLFCVPRSHLLCVTLCISHSLCPCLHLALSSFVYLLCALAKPFFPLPLNNQTLLCQPACSPLYTYALLTDHITCKKTPSHTYTGILKHTHYVSALRTHCTHTDTLYYIV